jgi:hypothetical protein
MKTIFFLTLLLLPTLGETNTYVCDKLVFEQLNINLQKSVTCARDTEKGIEFTHLKKELRESFKSYLEHRKKSRGRYKNNSSKFLQQTVLKTQQGKYIPVYFDKSGNAIRAKFFDNGADYFKDDFARYVKDNKIGFINKKGNIVIEAQYPFVSPFNNGYAKACLKCTKSKDGEHELIESDQWFFINKKNRRFTKPTKIIKLPFNLAYQKKVFPKTPYDNTPKSRKKLYKLCAKDTKACLNYACFLLEENLAFDLGGYKYSISNMSHSTAITPSKGQLSEQQLLDNLTKLSVKHVDIEILHAVANYSYGSKDLALKELEVICKRNNGKACHFLGMYLDHQGKTKAAVSYFDTACQLKINASCDNKLLLSK